MEGISYMKKIILSIDGMTCSACSNGLEKYLLKQDGIINASVNLVMSNALVEYDETKLNIKNVEASFILGHKNDTVFISARSLGQINVHVLMEKLGGGGHIDIAGAQLKNVTLNQAYKKVHQIIEEYLEEENQ